MASSSSLQTRGARLVTQHLASSARLRSNAVGGKLSTQADLLRLFAPGLSVGSAASYHHYAATRRPRGVLVRSTRAADVLLPATALGRRSQHTEPHSSAQHNSDVPPPSLSDKAKKPSSASTASAPVYQKAGPVPTEPPSTSHISRVLPAASSTGAELGSPANQTSASQALLVAERDAKELEKAEEERQWKEKPLATRAWIKVKEEAAHYWHGTKLLAKEVRISARLLRRLLLGHSLTRREHRQLKRTTADLLRLIPFVPFIIIPAGELLLPVAIKIFPNMLPSTFESKFASEEKRRRLIKVRLEMAKFLGETIREGGIQAADKVKTSDEFKEFFRKVRTPGESPSNEDIIKVAQLFDDEVTLDNLTRPQLVSMCRYMQINAFGTDNYLRYQIRHKLARIKRDDMTISAEGPNSMSLHELQSAAQNRGIQTLNLSEQRLRDELKQWIELHLHHRISGILLVLSKAFNYMPQGAEDGGSSQLKSLELTLSSLPENLLSEAELSVSKDSATNKQRLEVLQQQEELIANEASQEQAEEDARKEDEERQKQASERAKLSREEEEARSLLPNAAVDPEAQDASMTNEQLTELGEALSILSAKSSVLKEREELAALIKEVTGDDDPAAAVEGVAALEAEEKSADVKADEPAASAAASSSEDKAAASSEEASADSPQQSSASRSLAKRVKSMLQKIDEQLEEYDRDVGTRMNIIEASPTGKISVDDLEQALRLIKHRPDEKNLTALVDKLDVDNDGLVPLADLVSPEVLKTLNMRPKVIQQSQDLQADRAAAVSAANGSKPSSSA